MEASSNRRRSSLSVRAWDVLYKAIPWCIVVIFVNLFIGTMGSWISSISMPVFLKDFLLTVSHFLKQNIAVSVILLCLLAFILFLLWLLAKNLRESDVVLSEEEVRRLYLERIIRKTQEYELKQAFPGMLDRYLPPAQLWQIFYHLNFIHIHSTQPLHEYAFSRKEFDDIINDSNISDALKEIMQYEWGSSSHVKQIRITLADIWKSLTNENPAAVILGYSGSGKSMLVQALAFHMAERYLALSLFTLAKNLYKRIRHSDDRSLKHPLFPVIPPLIPILVSLEDFANERANDSTLTLTNYIIERQFAQWDIEGIRKILENHLKRGKCLVLFDAVNAIAGARETVKKEIKEFIWKYSKNRFIITSRTAGYDRTYFHHYPHYHIDQLATEQITDNLKKWCELVISEELTGVTDEVERKRIQRRIETRIAALSRGMEHSSPDQQIGELAKQPLLLTLLILIAVTPNKPTFTHLQRRIQLYKMAVPMLLQNYRDDQGRKPLTEEKAVEYLGLLAVEMIKQGKHWLTSREIKDMVQDDQTAIKAILRQIPEASSIFTKREEDKFGFSHPTYQEYFAARYLLLEVQGKQSQTDAIECLIQHACQSHPADIWREPFILAIAFQSYEEDSAIANKILEKLLEFSSTKSIAYRVHCVCLAVSAQMEINPDIIDLEVIEKIAKALIVVYEEAFTQQEFDLCEQIGKMICLWLDHLEYSPVQTKILHTILCQHATISLLSVLIEREARSLEKLHLLQVSAQKGQLTMSALEECVQSMCESFVKRNEDETGLLHGLLRHSLTLAADAIWLRFVLQLMAATENLELRRCCAEALNNAHPPTAEAQEVFELWKHFSEVF